MLYRLPECERVCSGICNGWSGGNIVSPYWLLFTVFGIVIPLAYIYFKKSMTIHIKI